MNHKKQLAIIICFLISITACLHAASDAWQKTALGPQPRQKIRPKRHYAQSFHYFYSTPSLAFEVGLDEEPSLMKRALFLSPDGLQHQHDMTANFHLLQLGNISIGRKLSARPRTTKSWTHITAQYEPENQSEENPLYLKLYISRLSPAVVTETNNNEIKLFDGKQQFSTIKSRKDPAWQIRWQVDDPVTTAYVTPAYAACPLGDNTTAADLAADTTQLAGSSAMLFWWGEKSHFKSSRHPLAHYGETERFFETYKPVDCPVLIIFENKPASVTKSITGGIKFSFAGPAGKIAILPLYGHAYPSTEETLQWIKQLPEALRKKCKWWADNLSHYPLDVTEEYEYKDGVVSITETFKYLDINPDGPFIAPLPPMLAVAKLEGLDIKFSEPISDLNYDVSLGSYMVAENTQTYTWQIEHLDDYVNFKNQPADSASFDTSEIEKLLTDEIRKLTEKGLLSPWYLEANGHWLSGDIPEGIEKVFFESPAERLFLLTQIYPTLPDKLKPQALEYIKLLRSTYPPENISVTPAHGLARRERYLREQPVLKQWLSDKAKGRSVGSSRNWYLANKLKPIEALYALAQYYQISKEGDLKQKWPAIKDILKPYLRNSDWASMFFFDWPTASRSEEYEGRNGVDFINTYFAACVGYTRLAQAVGDTDAEHAGFGLLARAAALRYAAGKFTQHLYNRGHLALPADPDWMMTGWTTWGGHLYIPDFTKPIHDIRQFAELNEYGPVILERSNYLRPCVLLPFKDMTPELALFLKRHLKAECEQYIKTVEFNCPEWYIARGEQYMGGEWNHILPWDPHQMYLAKLWIQNTPSEEMQKYLDVSWLERGDLYYIQKLAATINAHQHQAGSGDDWPTVAGNVARGGFIRKTVEPPYRRLWEVSLPGEMAEYAQPVISGGKVFLATLNNAVFALDASTGKALWTFPAGGPFLHSAAVVGEKVFCACNDGYVYAVRAADGVEIWKFKAEAGFWASVCCAEGKVFVGSRDGNFYAIDQNTGERLWSYRVGEKIHQTAAYSRRKVTFGAENGRVYMLDASSGEELWKTDPLPTLSFGFTWPVFEKTAVVYSPVPVSNIPLYYGFSRDARAIGWDKPNPEDISELPPGAKNLSVIREYLNSNIDRQCVYLLEADTGRLMSAVPAFVFRATPQPPPVIVPDGEMILAHSGWYWGESSPGFLGRVKITKDRTGIRDFIKAGLGPGGTIIGGMPADIRCQLTGSGHILFVSCMSSGGYDLNTGKIIELAAQPRGGLMHGIIPAEGKLFHISGGRLFCQTTKIRR